MTGRDIVDEIDALVDAQLEQESSGYDHNLGVEYCPHCGSEWHGLPITERMQSMRFRGYMDPGYRYAEDTSRVLCAGSDVPASEQPERVTPAPVSAAEHTRQAIDRIMAMIGFPNPTAAEIFDPASWFDGGVSSARWWRLDNPSDAVTFTFRREVSNHDTFTAGRPPRTTEYLDVVPISDPDNVDTVQMFRDHAADAMYRVRYPAADPDGPIDAVSARPDRLEIFAARAPRFGGTWVPAQSEHEDHIHVAPDPGSPYLPAGAYPRPGDRVGMEIGDRIYHGIMQPDGSITETVAYRQPNP